MRSTPALSPELQQELENCGQLRVLKPGELLIKRGDTETILYLLQSGCLRVEIERNSQLISIPLEAGDICGEMAFLDNTPRTTNVIAASASVVVALERDVTFKRLSARPLVLNELITQLAALQRIRLLEEQVHDPLDLSNFVDALAEKALQHRAIQHPYLRELSSGELPNTHEALADFAKHYYGYSSHFPRYLTALISRMERAEHRAALLHNLTEESGEYSEEDLAELQLCNVQPQWIVGIPHPQLFQRFRRALGVDINDRREHTEVVCWRELFLSILTNGTPAEALGALGLGTETIVQTIYQPFVEAINRVQTISPEDAVFFPLHTAVDDHHQATLKAIATDFAATPQGRADLTKGMCKALALRDSFWGWLYDRAQSHPVVA